MLTVLQFVFFISPWSTGKTLLMREKAVMWAKQNLTTKLFFVVVRDENAIQTSLLEMELNEFFHQKHNLENVEVLGIPSKPEDIFGSLLKAVTARPSSCWMVDEVIMPGSLDEKKMARLHKQCTKDLEQLLHHFKAQHGAPPLWIACAGILHGIPGHFKPSYLTKVLPHEFHLPEMRVPLRNTKETLTMAGLERNTDVRQLGFIGGASAAYNNPIYKIPRHLMAGVRCDQFPVNNLNDDQELSAVVETACRAVLERTGGAGFPVLCNNFGHSKVEIVKKGVEGASASTLVYHWNSEENCSEIEVKEWLQRRKSWEEKRVLITDNRVSRGWEASHILIIALTEKGLENLVMRTVGYCAVVKKRTQKY